MPRRIVSIAGPLAQFAVADDGTGWFWNGAAWVPWERGEIPQPDPAPPRIEEMFPSPTFSQEARDAEHQRRANEGANKKLDELGRQQEPPPVPPGVPLAPGQAPAAYAPGAVQRRGRPRKDHTGDTR